MSPVEKAISSENQSVDIEHISHWLKKYEGKYAASPCSCRLSRRTFDEGCADDPEDWCIGVGDMADYLVETNRGHYVTYDEVMEILQRAEVPRSFSIHRTSPAPLMWQRSRPRTVLPADAVWNTARQEL